MLKPSQKKIEILKRSGNPQSFKTMDDKEGVKGIGTSCFVKELNMILRGEFNKSIFWLKKARVFAVDGITKKIKGWEIKFMF